MTPNGILHPHLHSTPYGRHPFADPRDPPHMPQESAQLHLCNNQTSYQASACVERLSTILSGHLIALVGLICGLQAQLVQPLVGHAQHADEAAVPLQLHPCIPVLRVHRQLLPRRK